MSFTWIMFKRTQKDLVQKIKNRIKEKLLGKKSNHKKLFIVNLHTRHVSLYSSLFLLYKLFPFFFLLVYYVQANSCAQGSRMFLNRNKMYHNFVNTILFIKNNRFVAWESLWKNLWLKNILLKFLQLQKNLKNNLKILREIKKKELM